MPFVLDNSVAMVWGFRDEEDEYAERTLDLLGEDGAFTPAIWPLEVANALLSSERKGRISPPGALIFIELLGTLPITVEGSGLHLALGTVIDVGRTYGLTSYDASYLELAMRRGLPLATLDGKLRQAAGHAGVALVE